MMKQKKKFATPGGKLYQIDRDRLDELKAFCRQYPKKKEQIESLYDTSAVDHQKAKVNTNRIVDITAEKAVVAERLSRECKMIETAALTAAENKEDAKFIIEHATKGVNVDYLKYNLGMTTGINQFYLKRRKFFWLLDQLKE